MPTAMYILKHCHTRVSLLSQQRYSLPYTSHFRTHGKVTHSHSSAYGSYIHRKAPSLSCTWQMYSRPRLVTSITETLHRHPHAHGKRLTAARGTLIPTVCAFTTTHRRAHGKCIHGHTRILSKTNKHKACAHIHGLALAYTVCGIATNHPSARHGEVNTLTLGQKMVSSELLCSS